MVSVSFHFGLKIELPPNELDWHLTSLCPLNTFSFFVKCTFCWHCVDIVLCVGFRPVSSGVYNGKDKIKAITIRSGCKRRFSLWPRPCKPRLHPVNQWPATTTRRSTSVHASSTTFWSSAHDIQTATTRSCKRQSCYVGIRSTTTGTFPFHPMWSFSVSQRAASASVRSDWPCVTPHPSCSRSPRKIPAGLDTASVSTSTGRLSGRGLPAIGLHLLILKFLWLPSSPPARHWQRHRGPQNGRRIPRRKVASETTHWRHCALLVTIRFSRLFASVCLSYVGWSTPVLSGRVVEGSAAPRSTRGLLMSPCVNYDWIKIKNRRHIRCHGSKADRWFCAVSWWVTVMS